MGRLEQIAEWLAAWQGRHPPRVERIQIIVFAANHGVAARGVSAFPSAVTAQMVANFTASGAAINQLSGWLDATLNVVPLALDEPTGDITQEAALDEAACLAAWRDGMAALDAAATACEARQMTHTVKPEFAVVDLRMPDGSGLDVGKALRQARANMRIVILTGYGNIATAVAAVKVGAVDYLAKPANADEIHRRSMPATGRCRRRRRTRCPPIASVGNISSVSSSNSTATSRKRRVA